MNRFLFLDFETTGLDPDRCIPLEIAVCLTDEALNPLWRYDAVLKPSDADSHLLQALDPVVLEMHTKNGLLEDVKTATTSCGIADTVIAAQLAYYQRQGVKRFTLAGATVHFDRRFLRRYFPQTERLLFYRHLDVSVFKVLADAWAPELSPKGEPRHRAMADVDGSIADLKRWANTLEFSRWGSRARFAVPAQPAEAP